MIVFFRKISLICKVTKMKDKYLKVMRKYTLILISVWMAVSCASMNRSWSDSSDRRFHDGVYSAASLREERLLEQNKYLSSRAVAALEGALNVNNAKNQVARSKKSKLQLAAKNGLLFGGAAAGTTVIVTSPYWYDSWCYGPLWYDPWYGPGWYGPGWYDPWYRPWHRPGWYDPWYRPWHRPWGPYYPVGPIIVEPVHKSGEIASSGRHGTYIGGTTTSVGRGGSSATVSGSGSGTTYRSAYRPSSSGTGSTYRSSSSSSSSTGSNSMSSGTRRGGSGNTITYGDGGSGSARSSYSSPRTSSYGGYSGGAYSGGGGYRGGGGGGASSSGRR